MKYINKGYIRVFILVLLVSFFIAEKIAPCIDGIDVTNNVSVCFREWNVIIGLVIASLALYNLIYLVIYFILRKRG